MLKDEAGASELELDLAEGSRVSTVIEHYGALFPRLREMETSVVVARNHQFASREDPVEAGDELAFLPPVSGGAASYTQRIDDPGGHFFALTRDPVDACAIGRGILQGCDGALVTFDGVVRNNTKGRATRYLEYEGYEPMAVLTMAQIGREIVAARAISRIAMVHRLGRMEIGETSVVIAVAAPHRKAAFEAALEGIDRLKRLAPIWKKEYFADGEMWVEGQWDESVLNR